MTTNKQTTPTFCARLLGALADWWCGLLDWEDEYFDHPDGRP